jgi:hypothetical protein
MGQKMRFLEKYEVLYFWSLEIRDYVLPGSIIITDLWRAYDAAMNHMPQYSHETIDHSVNFAWPIDRTIHTQGVEGF